ncbi:MAG: PEP-CTERM sorting domain-containing protein [Myxococcota bacterium]
MKAVPRRRCPGLQAVAHGGFALLLVLLAAGAAQATSIPLFFNGPTLDGSPLRIGVSEGQALKSGLAVFDAPLFDLAGRLSVTSQVLDPSSIEWPALPSFNDPVEATSDWTVQTEVDFEDHVLLIFVTTTDSEYLERSGLALDPDEGWVLVRSQLAGQDYWFPAVDLGLLPSAGSVTHTQIHYLTATQLKFDAEANEYLLPQLMAAVTTVSGTLPVPEPGVGGLLGLSFVGLLLRRVRG